MNLQLLYFSPTGTTRKIIAAVSAGFSAEQITHFDLTLTGEQAEVVFLDGVALIAIPVYAGRVPEVCLQRLSGFSARGIPAVLIALYGNREYEDALVELRDVATTAGFSVIAAGAFVGEHSYSTATQPIAAGRPDQQDLELAKDFGQLVAQKVKTSSELEAFDIKGQRPYRQRVQLGGISPVTEPQTCTLCGACAAVCPTFVVEVTDRVATLAENCIMCCACVKACPAGARSMLHPVIQERRALLVQNCRHRKEPELFL